MGAHATSRTQSVCPSSVTIMTYVFCAASKSQMRQRQSLPPETKRRRRFRSGREDTRLPGAADGAQDTLLTPRPCALGNSCVCQLLSAGLKERTETEPSEEPERRWRPSSWGAKAMRFTEAVWWVNV